MILLQNDFALASPRNPRRRLLKSTMLTKTNAIKWMMKWNWKPQNLFHGRKSSSAKMFTVLWHPKAAFAHSLRRPSCLFLILVIRERLLHVERDEARHADFQRKMADRFAKKDDRSAKGPPIYMKVRSFKYFLTDSSMIGFRPALV